MEPTHHAESIPSGEHLIQRLGFRELSKPRQYNCIRNGEPLELTVHLYENRNAGTVLYYTEAVYIPNGKRRHTTLFRFNSDGPHETLHKYCLHALFFDEKMGVLFEEENKFSPAAHLDSEKAEQFQNWVRVFWNSNYFKAKYKELGGLEQESDLIKEPATGASR